MIRITSKKDGFIRCRVRHPAKPIEYPDGTFTAKQIKILQAEPMLVVEIIKEKKAPSPEEILKATKKAIEAGNVTKDGKPQVDAISKILGKDITAADRDEALEKIMAEGPTKPPAEE